MARSDTQFKKGQSGNPKGRPPGSRDKLSDSFFAVLVEAVEKHGEAVLDKLAKERPEVFADLMARMLPGQTNVRVKSDHTVTHRTDAVSETARFLEEALGRGPEQDTGEALPN